MKFRDFILKRLLADTDHLVGYDADGNYIRIGRDDLAASVAAAVNVAAQTVAVQYSANGDSWHDSYTSGDCYLRVKAGSGAWTDAIRICVSAYDIWLRQGNSGSEEDFLRSLQGPAGANPDPGGILLQDIGGYEAFLRQVNAAITGAQAAIVGEVTAQACERVLAQFTGLQLADITEVRSLSDDDYLTVVTADGLRKVKIGSLSDNVAVRTVSTGVLERSLQSQLEILGVTGAQNGVNRVFTVSKHYVAGSSVLFLNGQRLTPAADYREETGGFTMLTHAPNAEDVLIFEAVPR